MEHPSWKPAGPLCACLCLGLALTAILPRRAAARQASPPVPGPITVQFDVGVLTAPSRAYQRDRLPRILGVRVLHPTPRGPAALRVTWSEWQAPWTFEQSQASIRFLGPWEETPRREDFPYRIHQHLLTVGVEQMLPLGGPARGLFGGLGLGLWYLRQDRDYIYNNWDVAGAAASVAADTGFESAWPSDDMRDLHLVGSLGVVVPFAPAWTTGGSLDATFTFPLLGLRRWGTRLLSAPWGVRLNASLPLFAPDLPGDRGIPTTGDAWMVRAALGKARAANGPGYYRRGLDAYAVSVCRRSAGPLSWEASVLTYRYRGVYPWAPYLWSPIVERIGRGWEILAGPCLDLRRISLGGFELNVGLGISRLHQEGSPGKEPYMSTRNRPIDVEGTRVDLVWEPGIAFRVGDRGGPAIRLSWMHRFLRVWGATDRYIPDSSGVRTLLMVPLNPGS